MVELNVGDYEKVAVSFYERSDVAFVAKELLGKILVTNFNKVVTAGRIVETEAYNGIVDKASHAYNNRRTNRTEIMYGHGGVAYVYLCYGIHHLFNVVTNLQDVPHAVLVRAVEPVAGVAYMLERTGKTRAGYDLTKGPGNVSKALGISVKNTGTSLLNDELFVADDGYRLAKKQLLISTRIGVDYAAEDALLPYRFSVIDSLYVSGKKIKA